MHADMEHICLITKRAGIKGEIHQHCVMHFAGRAATKPAAYVPALLTRSSAAAAQALAGLHASRAGRSRPWGQ